MANGTYKEGTHDISKHMMIYDVEHLFDITFYARVSQSIGLVNKLVLTL